MPEITVKAVPAAPKAVGTVPDQFLRQTVLAILSGRVFNSSFAITDGKAEGIVLEAQRVVNAVKQAERQKG